MKKIFYTLLLLLALNNVKAQLVVRNISDIPDVSKLATKPNIILILADDMSYNTLMPDSGPAFLTTPHINKIATQGIRFKNSFVTFPLCVPSRSQLLTGYYPHVTGVVGGGKSNDIPSKFMTLPQIMKANGYRTALIGKYQIGYYSTPRAGWDYWFSFAGGIGDGSNAGYYNMLCNLNGTDTLITSHLTDAITHFTGEFLATTVSSQPFFLIISEAAPHAPYQTQSIYKDIYKKETVTVPANFARYSVNYPSYLYPDYEIIHDTAHFIKSHKHYYELVKGLDSTAKVVFDFLTAHNNLYKTMIVFTSDNGFMFGEHHLTDKVLPYEESIRVPLYIRYPAWFNTSGKVDSKHLALNLDLFTTMLDAAGAVDTFNTHGISLRYLANDSIKRNLFMYERIIATNSLAIPAIRAVRSQRYKYVKSYCNSVVEEFYDLKTDPHENVNQIYNPAYANRINNFRFSLDSIRLALNDTSPILISNCSMLNIVPKLFNEDVSEDNISVNYESANVLNLFFDFEVPQKSCYSIYNMQGKLIVNNKQFQTDGDSSLAVPIENLVPGMYIFKFDIGAKTKTIKFVKAMH